MSVEHVRRTTFSISAIYMASSEACGNDSELESSSAVTIMSHCPPWRLQAVLFLSMFGIEITVCSSSCQIQCVSVPCEAKLRYTFIIVFCRFFLFDLADLRRDSWKRALEKLKEVWGRFKEKITWESSGLEGLGKRLKCRNICENRAGLRHELCMAAKNQDHLSGVFRAEVVDTEWGGGVGGVGMVTGWGLSGSWKSKST